MYLRTWWRRVVGYVRDRDYVPVQALCKGGVKMVGRQGRIVGATRLFY
jgi:hypothetical protein